MFILQGQVTIELHVSVEPVEGLTTIEQGRDQFDSMGGWVCFQVIMDPVDKADPAL